MTHVVKAGWLTLSSWPKKPHHYHNNLRYIIITKSPNLTLSVILYNQNYCPIFMKLTKKKITKQNYKFLHLKNLYFVKTTTCAHTTYSYNVKQLKHLTSKLLTIKHFACSSHKIFFFEISFSNLKKFLINCPPSSINWH